ncbi:MAG TPA: hypothetical protein GX714_07575 [Chloroflexi bacterium]|nr:hypothetical protein [Chloroflexota bacterium]
MSRLGDALRRLVRWLFGSPIEELPPEFGDPRPPDLRAFESELEARKEVQQPRHDHIPPRDDE